MPTAKEMEELWAADFALNQIPLETVMPVMKGRVVGTIEFHEDGTSTVSFHDQAPQENPPTTGG